MQPQNNEALNYVQTHLAQGYSQQQIRDHFITSGWTATQVDVLFAQLSQPNQAPVETPINNPEPVVSPTVSSPQPLMNPAMVSSSGPIAPDAAMPVATSQPIMSASQAALVAAPQKYGVFQAIGDTFAAIRSNFVSYFLSLIIGIGLYAGSIAFLFLVILNNATSQSVFGTSASTISSVLTILFVLLVVLPIIYTFTGIMLALSVDAGAQGIKSKVGAVFGHGLHKIIHVVLAYLLSGLIIYAPLIGMYLISIFILIASAGNGSSGPAGLVLALPVLLLVSIVWALIFMLRFALVVPVAIFEPHIGVVDTLRRSRLLLEKGGQWFVFKGALLFGLLYLILSIAADQTGASDAQEIVSNILLAVLVLLSEGVLVLLYRNRVAVKGGALLATPNSPSPQAPQAQIASV